VAVFDGTSLASGPKKLFAEFFAFEEGLRNGVFVSAGDLDGDGRAELLAGGGPGGGPRVSAFAGADLVRGAGPQRVADFYAGSPDDRSGVRVAAADLDGDELADVLAGAGSGSSRVAGFLGRQLTTGATAAAFDLDAFPGSAGGVFVG
jgi:hypothetical protein